MTYINPRDPRSPTPQLTPTEPLLLTGGCYCKKLSYTIRLSSKEEARTMVCHCTDCKKTFGSVFGVTVKVPVTSLRMTGGKVQVHKAENGSGSFSYRDFCNECGSTICTYEVGGYLDTEVFMLMGADWAQEQAKDHFRQIALGSLDEPSRFEPRGEFYCSQRQVWLPEMPGKAQFWKQ
jgi:hypothetical protein